MSEPESGDRLAQAARRAEQRDSAGRATPEPSLGARLGQIGILGWTFVIPALGGAFIGRWLDRLLASGVVCTAALIVAGLAVGFWAAWKWMHRT